MSQQARHFLLNESCYKPSSASQSAPEETIQQQIYQNQVGLTEQQQIQCIIDAYKRSVDAIWRANNEVDKANFFDNQLDALFNRLSEGRNNHYSTYQYLKSCLEHFYITINCITDHDRQKDYLSEFLDDAHLCLGGSINRLQSLHLQLCQPVTLADHLSVNVRPAIVRDLARKHCYNTGVPAGMEIHVETAFLHYANCEGFVTPVAAYEYDQFVDAPMLNINAQVLSQLYEQLRQQYTPYVVLKSACDYWRQVLPKQADLSQFDTLKKNIQAYWSYLKDKIAESSIDMSQDFDTLWAEFCEQYYDVSSNQLILPSDLGQHLVNQAYTIAIEKQFMSELGALQAAARFDDLDAFKKLKERYASINELISVNGGYGQYNSVFYTALYYGSQNIVGYYLEHNQHHAHADDPAKIDLDNIDGRFNSAMSLVIQLGHIHLINQLVRYGVYPSNENNVARDIACMAIYYKQLEVIQAITEGDILQNNAGSTPSYHQLITIATNRGCYDVAFGLLKDNNTDNTHQLSNTDSHIRFDCLCGLIDFIHHQISGSLPETIHNQLMHWLDKADNILRQSQHPAYEVQPVVKLLEQSLSLSAVFYNKLIDVINNHYDKLKSINNITLFQQAMFQYHPLALGCLVNDVILRKPSHERLRCFQITISDWFPHADAFTDLASYLLMYDLDSYEEVFLKGGNLSYQHLVRHNQATIIGPMIYKTFAPLSYANNPDKRRLAIIYDKIAYQLNRDFNRATFQEQFDALFPTALTIYHSFSRLREYAASVECNDIAQQIDAYQFAFFTTVSQIIQQHLKKLTNQFFQVCYDVSESVQLVLKLHEMSSLEFEFSKHGFNLNYNLWDQAGQHSLLYYVLCKFSQTPQHYNFVQFLLNRAEIDKSQDSLLSGALSSLKPTTPANLLPDLLKRLIDYWDADINKADEWGEAPVIKLFKQKQSMRIIFKTFSNSLLQRDDLNLNVVDAHGVPALELAAKNGCFFDLPAKYRRTKSLGSTSLQNLLIGATKGNQTTPLKILLTGFNQQMLGNKPIDRQAILSSAIQAGSTNAFKQLLTNNLFSELLYQPQVKNDLVNQVLAKKGESYKRIFENMAAHNPNIATEVCAQGGVAPIHLAAANQLATVLTNLIINHEVDVNQYDDHHNTPLHYLVTIQARNNASFTHLLNDFLDYDKVDVNAFNNKGNTALHLLIQHQHEKAACYLIDRMRNDCLDTANQQGETPIQLAIQLGKVGVAKKLIKSGVVDLDQTNTQGQGLIQQAEQTPFMNSRSINQLCRLVGQQTGVVQTYERPTANDPAYQDNGLGLLARVSKGSNKNASTILRSPNNNETNTATGNHSSSAVASQSDGAAASDIGWFSGNPGKRSYEQACELANNDELANSERTCELDDNEDSDDKRRRLNQG